MKFLETDVPSVLAEAIGAGAVTTASEVLDAYTADTYWPALAAAAAGHPIARPDVVVRARTEEDVATALAVDHEERVPVGAIRRIKASVDPHDVMNPGKLGL